MEKHPYYDRESKETSFKIAVISILIVVVLIVVLLIGSALNLIELQ